MAVQTIEESEKNYAARDLHFMLVEIDDTNRAIVKAHHFCESNGKVDLGSLIRGGMIPLINRVKDKLVPMRNWPVGTGYHSHNSTFCIVLDQRPKNLWFKPLRMDIARQWAMRPHALVVDGAKNVRVEDQAA